MERPWPEKNRRHTAPFPQFCTRSPLTWMVPIFLRGSKCVAQRWRLEGGWGNERSEDMRKETGMREKDWAWEEGGQQKMKRRTKTPEVLCASLSLTQWCFGDDSETIDLEIPRELPPFQTFTWVGISFYSQHHKKTPKTFTCMLSDSI